MHLTLHQQHVQHNRHQKTTSTPTTKKTGSRWPKQQHPHCRGLVASHTMRLCSCYHRSHSTLLHHKLLCCKAAATTAVRILCCIASGSAQVQPTNQPTLQPQGYTHQTVQARYSTAPSWTGCPCHAQHSCHYIHNTMGAQAQKTTTRLPNRSAKATDLAINISRHWQINAGGGTSTDRRSRLQPGSRSTSGIHQDNWGFTCTDLVTLLTLQTLSLHNRQHSPPQPCNTHRLYTPNLAKTHAERAMQNDECSEWMAPSDVQQHLPQRSKAAAKQSSPKPAEIPCHNTS